MAEQPNNPELPDGTSEHEGSNLVVSNLVETEYTNDLKDEELNNNFVDVEPSTAESAVGNGGKEKVLVCHSSMMEDTFVDAMDQLNMSERGDSTVYIEMEENSEEKVNVEGVEEDESVKIRQLTYEISLLQASVEKAVDDREKTERKYKEEREMLAGEVDKLRRQLEVMVGVDNVVDRLRQAEDGAGAGEGEGEKLPAGDVSLQTMIADCSRFSTVLASKLEKHLQSEGTVRELHAVLFAKDQEIEDLSGMVSELAVSNDVLVSYLDSVQMVWSQSVGESSEELCQRDMHVKGVTNGLLSSLASVVQLEGLSDGDSVIERMSHVERGASLMIENYNRFVSGIDHLKQCLSENVTEIKLPDEIESGTVFDMVREELLGHKRKELDFVEKLNQVEGDNRKMLEQLDEEKAKMAVIDAELSKIKLELEQEKIKSATTKEKLSMAVTKGKALVQHRDSLKQSLNDKTNELEKCLLELEEKSRSLEAAEAHVEELVKIESLSASLQDSLSEREMVIKEIVTILSKTDMANGLHSLDVLECVRLLADERNIMLGVFMEHGKLKDSLGALNLPETVQSYELESQVNWLGESLSFARDNIVKLQGEIVSAQVELAAHESELAEAHDEIDHLKASILVEKREKDSLQIGLEDLSSKYEAIVEREFQVSSEKDRMLRMFLEASGMEDEGETNQPYSDTAVIVEKCIEKIRQQINGSIESSDARKEQFEEVQSLLYVRDQELMLHKEILEEDMLGRSEMTNLSDELKRVSQELTTLKEEKDALQTDLERSDEKSALIREKLSMAVKKGKGLVQEREGLKRSIDEKNTEVDKLKRELQQQESVINEFKDQISRLSIDVEHIPKLESDLLAVKDQRDQFKQFLSQSNSMLEKVVESIESVALPVDTTFDEPVGKIKCLVECFNEYQVGRSYAEQELKKLKEEADSCTSKLAEAYQTIRSLEDALSELEKNNSLLEEEKNEILVGKTYFEQEIDRVKDEASSHAKKFEEASVHIKSLEDALSLAEKNLSLLGEEKEVAHIAKSSAGEELGKVREEANRQAGKLAEANITIKSLEEALRQVEKNLSALMEEKDAALFGRSSLEKELEEVKSEAGSQASKLADAYAAVKSLEDALSVANNNISVLMDGKKEAENEIQALNDRLNASMEELAGNHGNLESQSLALFDHLNHLKVIMKDDALFSSMTQGFKKKLVSLRDLRSLLESIQDCFVEKGSNEVLTDPDEEKDPHKMQTYSEYHDSLPNGTADNIETGATDLRDIFSYFATIVEGFKKKNKLLEDNFEGFSSSMDEHIAVLLRALQATRNGVTAMLEQTESLKLEVKNLEAHTQAQGGTIVTLVSDMSVVLSACGDAAKEMQRDVDKSLVDMNSSLEIEKLNHALGSGPRAASVDATTEHWERLGATNYGKDAENLVLAAREIRTQIKELEDLRTVSLMTIEDLQNKLREAHINFENAIEERDLNQDKVAMLEGKLEALQNICDELKLKVQDYQTKEEMSREKDEELPSQDHSASIKEQDGYYLSVDQIKRVFQKINPIEIPLEESETVKPEFHGLAPVEKLFTIIDNVAPLQHQMKLLSREKEELQSNLAVQAQETKHLKKEAESLTNLNQDLEKTQKDLTELIWDVEKLIKKLGRDELVEDKLFGGKGLVPVLENLFMALTLECETLRSRTQESDSRLHENQKVVNYLSAKVKLLEDSIHSRPAIPDPVTERSIFDASLLAAGSEISEIEETGPLGRNSTSPAPTAAHVRTLKKGSSDHLALNIDPESDRLINHLEADNDKGHVFKSLNTSGLIPKQGKLMADRIDGIWVSGGRVLMSRPRARIGVIAYCLILHIWLLGVIL